MTADLDTLALRLGHLLNERDRIKAERKEILSEDDAIDCEGGGVVCPCGFGPEGSYFGPRASCERCEGTGVEGPATRAPGFRHPSERCFRLLNPEDGTPMLPLAKWCAECRRSHELTEELRRNGHQRAGIIRQLKAAAKGAS